jgi:beta-N-acetylhexosaminidase
MQPTFLGLSGLTITPEERALFSAADPAGYILFKRTPITAIEAARLNALAIAAMLRELGITVDCLPLLDVRDPEGHDIIGDRAFGDEPMKVAALGRATLDGLRQGGVCGVIKHIPGHGRARADSHLELPVVEASRAALERDFEPFRSLSNAPMAMTAHVTYTALDPQRCCTLSPIVIELIRNDIGFSGLLMSDDLGMHALGSPEAGGHPAGSNALQDFGARALASLEAGCDIALHCSGDFAEMRAICEAVPEIGPAARRRLDAAMAWAGPGDATPTEQWAEARDRLLAV